MNDVPTQEEIAAIAAVLNLAREDADGTSERSKWVEAARREAIGGEA